MSGGGKEGGADRPPRLSVVIPCYNERETIAAVLSRVLAADAGIDKEVIVVDDGSSDGTGELLGRTPGVRALRHERNRGKGAAVKTGIAAARGEVVLIQDADLEYEPADYKAVLAPILAGEADAVMGSRFAQERPRFFFGAKRSPFFSHYVGNNMIIALTNSLYGVRYTDYEGAYKAFRRELVAGLKIEADGFEYDNELVCKLLRRGARVAEAPISYQPRSYGEGKKIRWQDGLVMLWTIVKWRFKDY
ncbi:MAG: glycosyltransferase family 2 protein [Elusimicrobia bacterium]|nr:glycosyltransferase family 2 protein [Elusimicrobiota bacterium]